MRRSSTGLVGLLALVLVGCASGGGVPATATEPPGPHLTVVATDIAFDTATLTLKADTPNLIYFVNQDDAPHNIQIAANVSGAGSMFDGEIINKGAIVYTTPAFVAGHYFFLCKVHPNMNGTVEVAP